MIPVAWIGTVGIVAIEASYLPQIIRLFRLKRAQELSLFFPGLNLAGRLLALTYSALTGDHVFVVGFLFGSLLRFTLLLQVGWYRRASVRVVTPEHAAAPLLSGGLAR
jgi:lipid-A-disaccharide synthase-like uncharacterized protein